MNGDGNLRLGAAGLGCVTMVDAHVHVYPGADVDVLLGAACDNFAAAGAELGADSVTGVLMLAESRDHHWFDAVRDRGAAGAGWSAVSCGLSSLLLRRHDAAPGELLAVRGRQVVTAEGIEVLSLGATGDVPDGLVLDETLRRSVASASFTVLPWGVGKWLGRRGRLVARAIEAHASHALLVGDNGGRPWLWPESPLIRDARRRGMPVISGSDPLPVPGDEKRAGSFGFWLQGSIDRVEPLRWLCERVAVGGGDTVHAYGRSVAALDFVSAQLAMRRRGKSTRAPARTEESRVIVETPDIETSSAGYASRFAGRAGQYLLDVQSQAIAAALRGLEPGTVLDVGGGHGQLVDLLRSLGWKVTVHGTDPECERNLRDLHGKRDVPFLLGDATAIPVESSSFDLVIAVRLLSHMEHWPALLREMCRIARHSVVVDYPSKFALNALTPLLFGMKKSMEGNTRTYTSFSHGELSSVLEPAGFDIRREQKQFFMPMVLHRAARGAAPMRVAEGLCRVVGLTALAGSPVILRADRRD